MLCCRSREGAWIEIQLNKQNANDYYGRSREGAWIEIAWRPHALHPHRSRSREGAWIEMFLNSVPTCTDRVAPGRERGLK